MTESTSSKPIAIQFRVIFSIVIAIIPIGLAFGLYNQINCYIVNGPEHNHCIEYHPIILYVLILASPLVGLVAWKTSELQIQSGESS